MLPYLSDDEIDGICAGLVQSAAKVRYLRDVQPSGLPHLARPVVERPGGVMPLDEMTRRLLFVGMTRARLHLEWVISPALAEAVRRALPD